jgi:hypothetical protein
MVRLEPQGAGRHESIFRNARPRTPNKINTLAHPFNLSNMSSFLPPACTESAERSYKFPLIEVNPDKNGKRSEIQVGPKGERLLTEA